MDALVEGARGEELSVGREGDAVDGLLVPRQRVDTRAPLHVPQPHRRVKRRAVREKGSVCVCVCVCVCGVRMRARARADVRTYVFSCESVQGCFFVPMTPCPCVPNVKSVSTFRSSVWY